MKVRQYLLQEYQSSWIEETTWTFRVHSTFLTSCHERWKRWKKNLLVSSSWLIPAIDIAFSADSVLGLVCSGCTSNSFRISLNRSTSKIVGYPSYSDLQPTLDISNSEETGENVQDSQNFRYRETGLKQKNHRIYYIFNYIFTY